MGSIKDRNGMDLTEAEDIKKRWQEYTEELYKKDLHDPDNHDGVITHLEPDILECEVKWALERITTNKASGGDGIPVELFQILNDVAVNMLHSICQQIWKTQQATGLEKVSFHSNSKEKQGEVRKPSSVINEKRDENNRMEKTRDLFKKTRDTKGTFHAKMGKIKGKRYGPNRSRRY